MTEDINNNCCAACTCTDPHKSRPEESEAK
jgi:hypothetical protein